MKASYTVEGTIVRGWDLQGRNMDILWVIGCETVRVIRVRDDLHAIRRPHVQRYDSVVQWGDSKP